MFHSVKIFTLWNLIAKNNGARCGPRLRNSAYHMRLGQRNDLEDETGATREK
jgi:hypothetical protein